MSAPPNINLMNLFSRTSSPPPPRQDQQQQRAPSPQQTLDRPSPPPSPRNIDSLFRGLTHPQPQAFQSNNAGTAGSTPQSLASAPLIANTSTVGPSATANDRQTALLNLLGPAVPSNPPPAVPSPPQMQAPRTGPSPTGGENQGKLLLEQLMQGTSPNPLPQPLQQEPVPQSSPPRAPTPTRKSIFEFVSPFDALSSTANKRKPVPNDPPLPQPDPTEARVKTVENLMDQLSQSIPEDPYRLQTQFEPSPPTQRNVPPPPLPPPPKPMQTATSPHRIPSPPRSYAQARPVDSPTLAGSSGSPGHQPQPHPIVHTSSSSGRERDNGSPQMRQTRGQGPGPSKADDLRVRVGRKGPNSTLPPQTITIDVAQPLASTMASRSSVLVTPIALLKLESIYVPGNTIGVSSWIAYAMTKGRVRLIARSNGARALLKLPPAFPQTTSVIDMVCSRNRLAGVTSDGGLVVWEVPTMIDDDLPSKLLLCVLPTPGHNAFKVVKWHPQEPNTLAVGSDREIHLLDVDEAFDRFKGEPIRQYELHRVGSVYSIPSSQPLVSFAFDVPNVALASISADSTLALWSIRDKLPFWSAKIPGEGVPSSIDFLEGGLVIGRKQGTVLQLLPVMSTNVLSTVRFVNSSIRGDDPDMFGHIGYDARIQTLWIANSRRESLIALRVSFETDSPSLDSKTIGGSFEQVLEFPISHPTINVGILSAQAAANPLPEVEADGMPKTPPPPGAPGGPEMALVAFVVHTGGVDQVLIHKESFDLEVLEAHAKLPGQIPDPRLVPEPIPQMLPGPPPRTQQELQQLNAALSATASRLRSAPSSDVDVDLEAGKEEAPKPSLEIKGKPKNNKEKGKDVKGPDGKDRASGSDSKPTESFEATYTKELRKVEENLHTRIGRLIAKELDKQHHRLEEARAAEQAADFNRQETILKLISTELTKNTTRVVETAIRAEVQQSVLPALENITKAEVRSALNGQIVKGLGDSMKQALPNEIERLLLRPDVSNHVARTFSVAVTPIIERHVKDAINKTLIPAYAQATTQMHQDLSREMHAEILNLKKEVVTWQSEALKGQESVIRDMEHSIRALSDQVKTLTATLAGTSPPSLPQHHLAQQQPHRVSPAPSISNTHLRQGSMPTSNLASSSLPNYSQPPPSNPSMGWIPQGTYPTSYTQQPPPPAAQAAPPIQAPPATRSEDWDETFLGTLGTQDPQKLRELLSRCDPNVVMPVSGPSPLSQAVVLTLVHRLTTAVNEGPGDDSLKSVLWWLQRAAYSLNPNDPLISPYVGRVLPNVQQMLHTTSQRLAILPGAGGPQLMDLTRQIADIQSTISSKPVH